MELLSRFVANHKKKIITCLLLMGIAWGSTYVLGPDNKVEQSAEAIIKSETGIDLDFSPH